MRSFKERIPIVQVYSGKVIDQACAATSNYDVHFYIDNLLEVLGEEDRGRRVEDQETAVVAALLLLPLGSAR